MKKSVVLLLMIILALALTLTGCGGSGGSAEEPATEEGTQSEEAAAAEETQSAEGTDNLGDLLSSTYVDMMKGNEYLMKYKASVDMDGQMTEVSATVAVSGDNTAIISSGQGFETTMVIKEDRVYMIDHASKTVTSWAQTQEDMAADTGAIDTTGINYLGTGEEDGLVYEEYGTDGGTLRYYFDGKKLVKIKMIAEGVESTMEILEMSNEIPAGIFDIPSDYQQMEM